MILKRCDSSHGGASGLKCIWGMMRCRDSGLYGLGAGPPAEMIDEE